MVKKRSMRSEEDRPRRRKTKSSRSRNRSRRPSRDREESGGGWGTDDDYNYASESERSQAVGSGSSLIQLPPNIEELKLEHDELVRINFLPYRVGEGNPVADAGQMYFERTYYAHIWKTGRVLCRKRTFNKKCPICEFCEEQRDQPRKKGERLPWPSQRTIYLVECPPGSGEAFVFNISNHCFGKALATRRKRPGMTKKYEQFFSPTRRGLVAEFVPEEGKVGTTKFTTVPSVDFTTREREDMPARSLQKLDICLDDLLECPSYEDAKNAFFQSEEEDEKPRRRKNRSRDYDDDEEEDYGTYDDEEIPF